MHAYNHMSSGKTILSIPSPTIYQTKTFSYQSKRRWHTHIDTLYTHETHTRAHTLSFLISPSLSLSLSHTHTHTRTVFKGVGMTCTSHIHIAHTHRTYTSHIHIAHTHRTYTSHIHIAHTHRTYTSHIHIALKHHGNRTQKGILGEGEFGCLRRK